MNQNTQKKEQKSAYYCKIKEDLQNDQEYTTEALIFVTEYISA